MNQKGWAINLYLVGVFMGFWFGVIAGYAMGVTK